MTGILGRTILLIVCVLGLIGGGVLLLFLQLCALYYAIARWLFLRDAGRKLTHIDRQLGTAEGLHEDLRAHIAASRR